MNIKAMRLYLPLMSKLFLYQNSKKNKIKKVNELYNDIRINLQNIFNTRSFNIPKLKSFSESYHSFLHYGINNYFEKDVNKDSVKMQMCNEFYEVISIFEPRLTEVELSIIENDVAISDLLHVSINAKLAYNNINYDMRFLVLMNLTNKNIDVLPL